MPSVSIDGAASYAELHAKKCDSIIETNGLAEALEYCKLQGIDPPQCSLTAQSENASNLRNKAKRMLCEVSWWERRIGISESRDFEYAQIQAGKVINGVSNESYLRHSAKRRR